MKTSLLIFFNSCISQKKFATINPSHISGHIFSYDIRICFVLSNCITFYKTCTFHNSKTLCITSTLVLLWLRAYFPMLLLYTWQYGIRNLLLERIVVYVRLLLVLEPIGGILLLFSSIIHLCVLLIAFPLLSTLLLFQ